MNTVIEIKHKNYTENVIVTEENHEDVIELLTTDKEILDYEVIVQGDVDVTYFSYEIVCGISGGKNVGVIRRLENTLRKMENRTYFKTDLEANRFYEKIEILSSNIRNRMNQLTNLEKLYV